MKTIAYVYKWTHLPTLSWYIGSRYAIGCHPNDGYLCSSKKVKPLILSNPTEWSRQIICEGESKDIYQLETEILQLLDAKNDPRSFNQHNNDNRPCRLGEKHTEKSLDKMRGKRPPYGPQSSEHKNKRANKKRGIARPDLSAKNKLRTGVNNPNFGKVQSDEWKRKNSEANAGKPKPKIVCPHCNTLGGSGVMQRWHFDNCKKREL